MKPLRPSIACLALLLASPAHAHRSLENAGILANFLEGNLIVFDYPETLLPLVAVGFLVALWGKVGAHRLLPVLITGQLLGIGLATTGLPHGLLLMGAGALVAILAALLPAHSNIEVRLATGVIGMLAIAASLEGHTLFELPLALHVGLLVAATVTFSVAATLPRMILRRFEANWLRILWRVAASWIGAILILYFAYTAAP